MKINVGTEINLTDLLQTRLLIQANSGGGKSVLARVAVEESNTFVPFVVFDIDGEYYTLKEVYGDVLIIGGQHADVPINLKSAKLLPKEIISNRISVIIDLSDLTMADRILYAKYFIEALMELPREYWVNYLFFLEEAHKLCGEQDKQASAQAVKDLMSRGRKRGYCGVLITQRISKLHKDAAAECNNKFIGRTYLDIDMDRAAKELGFSKKEDRLALRDLKPGEFYAFGTSIKPHHVHKVKVKLPKTKVPRAGQNMEIKPKAPTEKLKAVLAKLNAPAPETKHAITSHGTNGKIFQHSSLPIRTYEAEYKAEKLKVAELMAAEKLAKYTIDQLTKTINNGIKALSRIDARVSTPVSGKNQEANPSPKTVSDLVNSNKKSSGNIEVPQLERYNKSETRPLSDYVLGKCPLAILTFLASFSERSFTKAQIGVASGYSPNSGSFNNALSELNSKQLIIKEGSNIKASGNAIELMGDDFTPQIYSAHTYKDKLGKCEREIYEALLEYPHVEFTKQTLAAATPSQYSHTSGSFNNALSTLNTLELIKRTGGHICLNPELLELI